MSSKNQSESLPRQEIPPEFVPAATRSGFGRHVGPYYRAFIDDGDGNKRYWLGLKTEDKHGGAPERGHGGMLLTLLDEVMGHTATIARDGLCVTVTMQTSFCASYRIGDFLRATGDVSRMGKSMVFVDGRVYAGSKVIGTASGVWMYTGEPIPGRSKPSGRRGH